MAAVQREFLRLGRVEYQAPIRTRGVENFLVGVNCYLSGGLAQGQDQRNIYLFSNREHHAFPSYGLEAGRDGLYRVDAWLEQRNRVQTGSASFGLTNLVVGGIRGFHSDAGNRGAAGIVHGS